MDTPTDAGNISSEEFGALATKLAETQQQLIQSEKLASVGQLAAGVAHEINNPIGYIFSNISTLATYLEQLFEVIAVYEASERCIGELEILQRIKQVKQGVDLEMLKQDIPELMAQSKEGMVRVRKIVQDLKDFSRVDSNQEWQWCNLHDGIDSTLNIVNNEVKYKADVVKCYGEIPEVECLPMQINQVVMNLVMNAAQAIAPGKRGTIVIETRREADRVCLVIQDNGEGISQENMSRIFDPFFTTKPVGKGTGLGLSLSYGIIQKHLGLITVESELGEGSRFCIELPIQHFPN